MRFLYIFPHPDDESFGPAAAMAAQKRAGHEVFLYTLTKGGATKVRFELGLSVDEMGEIRHQEMLDMAKVLQLDGFSIEDLTDSGLKELDPREIETLCREHILKIRPDVVVSYPVHGISGFQDHLVMHAVIKRVYLEMKPNHPWLKRLAFFTIDEAFQQGNEGKFRLHFSTPSEIDCRLPVSPEDNVLMDKALDCYKTYKKTIDDSFRKCRYPDEVCFEFFQEAFDPPLSKLEDQFAVVQAPQ